MGLPYSRARPAGLQRRRAGAPGNRGRSRPIMPPPYCYDHPRPAVTVDLAAFALDGDRLKVLMIRRKHDPFAGQWALPGGFLDLDEPIEAAARRALKEATGR